MRKIHLDTIDSTNDYVKAHHRELVDFTYVQTDRQTAGRGRLGREWVDEGGSALFSILLKTYLSPVMADQIPLVAAMAVHKTVANYLMGAQIKWPNDIVVDGKKLAGILVEALSESDRLEAIVVGIGINVNNLLLPPDLISKAVSMRMKTGREHRIDNLVDEVVKVFALEYIHLLKGEKRYLEYANKHSALIGKWIVFHQGNQTLEGKALKIADDGALMVDTGERTVALKSGEVTLHENGY